MNTGAMKPTTTPPIAATAPAKNPFDESGPAGMPRFRSGRGICVPIANPNDAPTASMINNIPTL